MTEAPAKPVVEGKVEEPKPLESGATASSFFERMTLTKRAKAEEKEKKPDEAKPVETPPAKPAAEKEGDTEKKPDEAKPAAKPKSAKKVVAPMVLPPEPVDHSAIATAAATAAVAAVTKATPAKREEPIDAGVDDEEKETVAVLERMEKEWPAIYSGRAKKYVESLAKAKKYQADWEAANKGKTYDPDDDEHDEFYKENDVDWNDVHFFQAIAKMDADKVEERNRTKETAKTKELESRNRLLEATPEITKRRSETARALFTSLGDDYKAVINDDGSINGSEVKRLIDEDPLRAISFQAALRTEMFAEDIFKITNRLVEFDDKDPNHNFIATFVTNQEALMRSMPAENQVNEKGQRFATAEEYAAMTPARRLYYWRFSDKDIADLYAEKEAVDTKEAIAAEEIRMEKAAAKRGFTKSSPAKPAAQVEAKTEETPAPVVEKPVSPASGVAPRPAQLNGNTPPAKENKTGNFLDRWLST